MNVRVIRSGRIGTNAAMGDPTHKEAEAEYPTARRLGGLGRLTAGVVSAGALRLVPSEEPEARCGLLLVLGKSRLEADDLDGARDAFIAAEDMARLVGLTIVELAARSHLAEITRRQGRRDTAEMMCRSVLAFASRVGLSEHPECAAAHLLLATVLLDTARIDEALPHIEQAKALAERIPCILSPRPADTVRQQIDAIAHRGSATTPAELTKRERAVLQLLPSQLTLREIAGELYVSINTLKTHTRSIYRKLGVRTRHAAIEQARRSQLL